MARGITYVFRKSIFLAGAALLAGTAYAQVPGTVSGFVETRGTRVPLKHCQAQRIQDPMDKDAEMTLVIMTAAPLPAGRKWTEEELSTLGSEGKLLGAWMRFSDSGRSTSTTTLTSQHGEFSFGGGGGSKSKFEKLEFAGGRVSGTYAESGGSDIPYRIEVTFSAPLASGAGGTTPGDALAAEQSPLAEVYAAYSKAVQFGDREAVKAVLTKQRSARLQALSDDEAAKMLALQQNMMSGGFEFLRASEKGDTAQLTVRTMERRGVIDFVKEDGNWKVSAEAWKEIDPGR